MLDSARSLTGARFGVMTPIDETGQVQDSLSSGLTSEEAEELWSLPDRRELFGHFGSLSRPLRVPDVLGDLTIDYAERLVTLAGRPVQLRAKEYQLLYELSVNAGRVVTHDDLLRRMWGANKPDDLRALRAHLRRLRLALGEKADNPTYFFTEPRVGYRMARGEGQTTVER